MTTIESGVLGEFPYAIVKHDELGHLCGYMAVPPAHPWFGKDYDDVEVNVHGGLTFGKRANNDYPAPLEVEAWWYGFDCAHSGDYSPGIDLRGRGPTHGEVFRDRDYVYHEIERMATQAADALAPSS